METNISLNKKLLQLKSELPELILVDHFKLRPDLEQRYTEHQKENFKKDVAWILSFLADSVIVGQPILFEEFVSWLRSFLLSVRVPMKDVAESLELIKIRINSFCNADENEIINPIMEKAVTIVLSKDQTSAIPSCENNLSSLAQNYLSNLLKGNRTNALSLVMSEVASGVPVKDMYTQVFQPVQYEIGLLWQTNKISVAQEHYCTGATQLIMSQLYPFLFTGERKNRKMVTTCVPGELHEMGARMVTDFFEMSGWDTYYLGANMPIEGVISCLREIRPLCLAISATMSFHVSAVQEMIQLIRTASGIPSDLKILVGGYPFKVAEGLWITVGADGYAVDANDAVELAEKLTAA